MVWDPKTKLVSPQFHVMFDNNFDTVQAPDPNITQADTMDRLFKTNRYKYDDPFGKEHTYLFSHGGVNIHPYNLTPTIETCQASFTMTPTHDEHHSDTQNNTSTKNTHNNTSILSMQDLVILHMNNIFPQSSKNDFKAYKHLHGIDMQIHSITKSPKQKAQEMELLLNYSHSRNPTCIRAHMHRHIQAPREPLNSRLCWRMCTLSQGRT
jgi:hypothetical protein